MQDDAYVRPMGFLWRPPGPVDASPLVALELPLAAIRFTAPLFLRRRARVPPPASDASRSAARAWVELCLWTLRAGAGDATGAAQGPAGRPARRAGHARSDPRLGGGKGRVAARRRRVAGSPPPDHSGVRLGALGHDGRRRRALRSSRRGDRAARRLVACGLVASRSPPPAGLHPFGDRQALLWGNSAGFRCSGCRRPLAARRASGIPGATSWPTRRCAASAASSATWRRFRRSRRTPSCAGGCWPTCAPTLGLRSQPGGQRQPTVLSGPHALLLCQARHQRSRAQFDL